MPSTLNGDFLQLIIPYYIRSSCESEVPVPMTRYDPSERSYL